MAKVYGLHEFELHPGVDEEAFARFFHQEIKPMFDEPNWNLVLLKGCSILGVAVGSNALRDPTDYRRHLLQMIDWIAAGTLKPVVTATYPLARTADALNDVMQRKVQGKAMVVV